MLTDGLKLLRDFFSVQNLGHLSFKQPDLEGDSLAIGACRIGWLNHDAGVGTDLVEEWHIGIWEWHVWSWVGGWFDGS